MTIFNHLDYKEVILKYIDANATVRGYQRQLAEAAKCQKSYFSHMLHNEKTHLNQEQMLRLAMFWNLSTLETDYFLELLGLAKTTFEPLRRRIKGRLQSLKGATENLSQRYAEAVGLLPANHEATYYSSWVWSAVHMLVGLDEYQTPETISARLQIPVATVRSSLLALQGMGLIRLERQRWKIKPGHMHLPRESPLTATNHMNWRHRAVLDSQSPTSEGLHYTVVHSHSVKDLEKIKDLLLKTIDTTREAIKKSADEEVTCLCIDLFRL